MRSGNPVLRAETFAGVRVSSVSERMTIEGTTYKSIALLLFVFCGTMFTWSAEVSLGWTLAGAFGGLIVAMVTIFKHSWAPFTAPLYAVLEGLFLGGISFYCERHFPGIVFNAVCLTFGTLFCMLLAYQVGLIKVTQKFRMGVVAATGAIFLVYMVSIVLSLFGTQMPFIHDAGPIGIGISLFIVVIAALNLALDFDLIEQGAAQGAPKYMEWFGAFALLVTLVWLYLEILHLLMKLRQE